MAQPFDRRSFEDRVRAVLRDDIRQNGRITPDGISLVSAEAEFFAKRMWEKSA